MAFFEQSTHEIAQQVAGLLMKQDKKIVFAESCTSGLLAATLGRISGISKVLCGSAVTYRDLTKSGWLGVDSEMLSDKQITAVSEPVAHQMAIGVLEMTPEADWAVSVTGHLGPGAPEGFDGLVFVGIVQKGQPENEWIVHRINLPAEYADSSTDVSLRVLRQDDLVGKVLLLLLTFLRQ